MRSILPILIIFTHCLLTAQNNNKLAVTFNTADYHLSSKSSSKIDSFIKQLSNIPEAFYAVITGHTDNEGDLDFNMDLSKKRANEVAKVLKQKGFFIEDSSVRFFAFTKPVAGNTSETEMAQNRRVEVNVFLRKYDLVKSLGIKDFAPKRYKLDETAGGTVKIDSTTITVPPDAFLFSDGAQVDGEIEVEYSEYKKPVDFLLSQVPMSTSVNGEQTPFNSGGMFSLRVFKGDKEIFLKNNPDKQVNVKFKLVDSIPNLNFYNFPSGAKDWNLVNYSNHGSGITDPHGDLMLGDIDFFGTNECFRDTTTQTITQLYKKMQFLLASGEPVKCEFPYKSIKANTVEFNSPYYALIKTNNEFKVQSLNGYQLLGPYVDYTWEIVPVKKPELVRGSEDLWNAHYTTVKVKHEKKDRFSMFLANNSGSRQLIVKGHPANIKSNRKAVRRNKANSKLYSQQKRQFDKAESDREFELEKRINHPISLCRDSLKCLFEFNRTMLPGYSSERTKEESWFDYFNANKNELKKRFECQENYKACFTKAIKRRDSLNSAYIEKTKGLSKDAQNLFAQFNIPTTGIFNADAVQSIQNKQEIIASYTDDNGKPIKVIAVFLNVKGLNGIIKYDGYAGYSPYKFVCSRNSPAIIIAVDKDLKTYMCSQQQFKSSIEKSGDKTFILRPVNKTESKNDLGSQML